MASVPEHLRRFVADPIVRRMMAADRVDEDELLRLLVGVAGAIRATSATGTDGLRRTGAIASPVSAGAVGAPV